MDNDTFNSPREYVPEKKSRNSNAIFLIALIVLLGTGIFLFANNVHKTNVTKTLSDNLAESDARYKDLDSKYNDALAEIDSYKGKNASLDSILNVKEKYILDLKDNLNKSRRHFQLTESDYKNQMGNINLMVDNLNHQLDSLQQQNKYLTVKSDSLGRNLSEQLTQNTELKSTNTVLSKKVAIGSLLKAQNINAMATRAKSNGKQVETDKAKKAEQLNVCFDVPANDVADAGSKTMYVRILSPEGTPLAIQDKGSGILQVASSADSAAEIQYTTSANFDYQQQAKNVCVNWSQGTPYKVGKYTAEIYQDGYLVGTKEFELK